MAFTENVLLTCILYRDAGPGSDYSCLQVQYINFCHRYHIFSPTLFFGDAMALLRESYMLV